VVRRRAEQSFTRENCGSDRRVEGALGGSALGYFRVTVDHPGAAAIFERP
jgi:hypothetical protein